MPTKVYAFFRACMLKFQDHINDLVFINFSRKKNHNFSRRTVDQVLDSDNIAVFNNEFSVGFSLKKGDKGKYSTSNLKIKIGIKNISDNSEKSIGKWKLDLANLPSPSSSEVRKADFQLDDETTVSFFYNAVIVLQKDYPHGMPSSFFSPTKRSSLNDISPNMISDYSTNNQNVSFSPLSPESTFKTQDPQPVKTTSDDSSKDTKDLPNKQKYSSSDITAEQKNTKVEKPRKALQSSPIISANEKADLNEYDYYYDYDYNDTNEKKKGKKGMAYSTNRGKDLYEGRPSIFDLALDLPFYSVSSSSLGERSNEDIAQYQIQKIYIHTLEEQHNALESIAFKQGLTQFSMVAFKTISHPKFRNADFSDDLIRPFKEFKLFEVSNLTNIQFNLLMSPIKKAIESTMKISHSVPELLSLLTTVLHFGTKMIYEAIPFTTVYTDVLPFFEEYMNKMALLLNQSMVAVLASSIDISQLDSNDLSSITLVQNETFLFLQNMRQMNVPKCVIELIQYSCCKSLDPLLYNSLVDSKEKLTEQSVKAISNKIRIIQGIYHCDNEKANDAFEQTVKVIKLAESLLKGIEITNIGPPSPLRRSIGDRCDPPVVLPGLLKIDRLGPVIDDTSTLRISCNIADSLKITFDWLLENEPSLFQK